MHQISTTDLPGAEGPHGTRIRRHFIFIQRAEGIAAPGSSAAEAFADQYEDMSSFANTPPHIVPTRGGDMNEERVLELPTGEELHCISYHGDTVGWLSHFREYANHNNLLLVEIKDGLVHFLEGRDTQESLPLSDCSAYRYD